MRHVIHRQSSLGSRQGIALLAVLAFILLLTILTVSYISFMKLNRLSTASYSNSVQAQEIAEGGLQDIISDLHAEIVAGSIKDPGTTYTQNGVTIYVPATNSTSVPARIGYVSTAFSTNNTTTTFAPSFVRVSRATGNANAPSGDAFFTNIVGNTGPYTNNIAAVPGGTIINRASLASTGNSSVNGRSISAARWNKTYLLAATAANVPSPFATAPPDWVYVTRTGSRVCTTTEVTSGALKPSASLTSTYTTPAPGTNPVASPVVGRYAFVMYDEGGLLDANVAGYPSAASSIVSTPATGNPAGISQALNGKSYSAYADLTQLPGLTGSQSIVDSFVNWRNASFASTAGSPLSGANFFQAVYTGSTNGFLKFQSSGSGSDSPFLSRQDLINYFSKIDTSINTTSATYSQALPYLGTFSRAISAPTYTPPLNSANIPKYVSTLGTAVAYKDQAETTGVPNRDLANLRFPGTGTMTITHYTDDATATPLTYAVNGGDPFLQSRFSLAKINWLGQTDPTTGNFTTASTYAVPIQACFGLVWGKPGTTTTSTATTYSRSTSTANGGNPCWNYVGSPVGPGGSSQAVSGVIETLDLVAKEGREPNFFELLKAAILKGSLGLGPGPACFNNGLDTGSSGANDPYDFEYPTLTPAPPIPDRIGAGGLFAHTFGPNSTVPVRARIPDTQIIQIGANIIDQFDADSYPTAIYFPYYVSGGNPNDPVAGSGPTNNAIFGPVTMIYGEENLPLLNRMVTTVTSPNPSGATPTDDTDNATHVFEGWIQPEIWNPHQQPLTALTGLPHNFQIRAYGSAFTHCNETGNPTDPIHLPAGWNAGATPPNTWNISLSPTQVYYPGLVADETGPGATNGTITFTDTSTTSSFYATPRLLTLADANGITGVTNVTSPLAGSTAVSGNIALSNFPYYNVPQSNGTTNFYNHFVAFSTGLIPNVDNGAPYQPFYVCTGWDDAGVAFQATGAAAVPCTSYALGWVDSANNFHPYSFISGVFLQAEFTLSPTPAGGTSPDPNPGRLGAVQTNGGSFNSLAWGSADPRTDRFSHLFGSWEGGCPPGNSTLFAKNNTSSIVSVSGVPSTGNFISPVDARGGNNGCNYWPEDWSINSVPPTAAGNARMVADPRATTTPANTPTYYADPDGVVRPADGVFTNVTTGDGVMLFTSAGTGGTAAGDTASGSYDGNSSHGRRPVILNRPFRSVAELGYVFRDLPFKTLDFFSASSADAALLDVFSLTDESKISSSQINSVVAGQVNISNAPSPVLLSILSGGSKKDLDPTYNVGTEAATIVKNLEILLNPVTGLRIPNPILNRAALVTSLSPAVAGIFVSGSTAAEQTAFTATADKGNKAYIEAPMRALADVTNTRTWNLLIDVIAQSGQMASSASTLNDFVVQGERRYWLHVAIDRYTGKIVAEQLEPVYE